MIGKGVVLLSDFFTGKVKVLVKPRKLTVQWIVVLWWRSSEGDKLPCYPSPRILSHRVVDSAVRETIGSRWGNVALFKDQPPQCIVPWVDCCRTEAEISLTITGDLLLFFSLPLKR